MYLYGLHTCWPSYEDFIVQMSDQAAKQAYEQQLDEANAATKRVVAELEEKQVLITLAEVCTRVFVYSLRQGAVVCVAVGTTFGK